MFRTIRLLLVVSLLCGFALIPVTGHAKSDGTLQEDLLQIARAAISTPLDILTETSPEQSMAVDSAAYVGAIQDQVSYAAGKRSFLMERGLWYSGYTMSLQPVDIKDLENGQVLMRVVEHTELQISTDINDPLAPKTYEYELPHDLVFVMQDDGWVLVSDRTEPFGPTNDDHGISDGGMISPDEGVAQSAIPGQAIRVNRSAVVNYAYQYWSNYNTSYRRFDGNSQGGDCTNFVSQAMRAGGWSFTYGPDWRSTREWWYNFVTQTWTWVNVNNFYSFMTYANRGSTVLSFTSNFSPTGSFFNPLSPGDLLQFDIAPPNGSYDHNMIITSKDSRGYIYLTYHTSNTRDRPILDLMYATPNYRYRGLRIY